jgi:hypothetical protein
MTAPLTPLNLEQPSVEVFSTLKTRSGKTVSRQARAINCIATFADAPDENIAMLQKACQYPLTDEQVKIAKMSVMEKLPTTAEEMTILDLVQLWEHTPALSEFANILRKHFLP